MNFKAFAKKYSSAITALFLVTTLYVLVSLGYDMHYELNDDTMMRNILSGSYTGVADARCYFILYPMGALIALLYKVLPFIQWYDVILIGCQFVCLWLITARLLSKCHSIKSKVIVSVLWICFVAVYLMKFIILVTFTIVSGMLAVTAIFLFITEEDRDNLLVKSIPSIILLFVSFCIRYMIVPMMLPFICIGGMYQWSKEKEIFSKETIKKYFSIFGIMLVLLAAAFAIDKAAYSSQEWVSFKSFCEDRASIYDYTYVPVYEVGKEFYTQNNITYEQYCLLRSYDFGLDENIGSDIMAGLSEYTKKIGPDLREKINIALGAYRIQITDKIGTQYHTLIFIGYILLFLSINKNNKFKILFFAAIMFFSRSVIWLYLLGQGRVVERVINPLYWAEFAVLFSIAVSEPDNRKKYKNILISVCVAALCLITFNSSLSELNTKYKTLNTKAYQYEMVQKYCLENPDNFYFAPVYSIGVLSEKVFDGCEEPQNLELLGGWLVNNPLYFQKLEKYDIEYVDDSVISNDNIYIIQHNDYVSYDTTYPFEWLIEYYKSNGYDVEVLKTDTIVDNIEVYKIKQIN